jgi:hypothetical protein
MRWWHILCDGGWWATQPAAIHLRARQQQLALALQKLPKSRRESFDCDSFQQLTRNAVVMLAYSSGDTNNNFLFSGSGSAGGRVIQERRCHDEEVSNDVGFIAVDCAFECTVDRTTAIAPPGTSPPLLPAPPFFLRATTREIKCCLVHVIAAVLQLSSPGGHMRGGAN